VIARNTSNIFHHAWNDGVVIHYNFEVLNQLNLKFLLEHRNQIPCFSKNPKIILYLNLNSANSSHFSIEGFLVLRSTQKLMI